MNANYVDTVRLLLAIAPAVFASGRFAMKGGTALNLFVQEMPRLSVDIDLVFVDHRPCRPSPRNLHGAGRTRRQGLPRPSACRR
jgi:predicted nucleotidyltransferase component of viral defense system